MNPILIRVRNCGGTGLLFGISFSVVVAIVFMVHGSAPFEGNGTTLPAVVALYLIAGTIAGAVVGLLQPFARSGIGAAAVGVVAALPVFMGVGIMLYGFPTRWDRGDWVVGLTLSIIEGATAGLILRGLWGAPDRFDGATEDE